MGLSGRSMSLATRISLSSPRLSRRWNAPIVCPTALYERVYMYVISKYWDGKTRDMGKQGTGGKKEGKSFEIKFPTI